MFPESKGHTSYWYIKGALSMPSAFLFMAVLYRKGLDSKTCFFSGALGTRDKGKGNIEIPGRPRFLAGPPMVGFLHCAPDPHWVELGSTAVS